MSVYKRKDRSGEYWFRIRHKQAGKTTRYHRYGGTTRKAAELAERKLIGELEEQKAGNPTTGFNEFVLTHYWVSQKNHLSPKGIEREKGILNNHLGPYFSGLMSGIDRQRIVYR